VFEVVGVVVLYGNVYCPAPFDDDDDIELELLYKLDVFDAEVDDNIVVVFEGVVVEAVVVDGVVVAAVVVDGVVDAVTADDDDGVVDATTEELGVVAPEFDK
jgi:hypothetical protein